jgi:glycosyltransferase involved in cell wall biosynthesis
MRVFFFTKYTQVGASSRYRSYQYFPALDAACILCTVVPLFGDDYLAYKYAHGRARLSHVLTAFIMRLWAVLCIPRKSTVFIEYELLPYCPAWLERWLVWRGCRLVTDYDDALFHQYDEHPNPWVRRFLGRKIATVMRLSHTVITGNEYLAAYARGADANQIVIIPTVIDLRRYHVKAKCHNKTVFTIGWIGSPSTAKYLHDIAPALAEVCRDGRARVRLVGSGSIDLPGVPLDVVAWRDDTEVEEIGLFDVGIMPLPNEPWARGKCGFKLIQYMACGAPVIASPVGVNTSIVTQGDNGFLADTHQAWVSALQCLMADEPLSQQMGRDGRYVVEQSYCLDVAAPKLIDVLQQTQRNATT